MINQEKIRNFSIIAHIDHGKSTLADRMLEATGVVSGTVGNSQLLDSMDLERERGITIKSQTVCMPYTAADGQEYIYNLIDTPGHVDFSYEVSRSLASCEGALLLIDASQGVEAQTLANLYLAMENNLEVIPVINKIDLPSANLPMVYEQIERDLGFSRDEVLQISAKAGLGINELLAAVVDRVPAPTGDRKAKTAALIFDSIYDSFRGTIITTRVFEGELKVGDEILLMRTNQRYKIDELGVLQLGFHKRKKISAGEVGYIIAGIKSVVDTKIGDTITRTSNPMDEPLGGYKEIKPMVYASIYPISSEDYQDLRTAVDKLKLNDSSFVFEADSSVALGFGFRCGFLGLLHLEIVQERLEREYNLDVIVTAPTVEYRIIPNKGKTLIIDNPVNFPDPQGVSESQEPFIDASIYVPADFTGNIISLCLEKRGTQTDLTYLDEKRVLMKFDLPLAEVVYDFYGRLKSVTKGYASFDYELSDYRKVDLVKMEILVNGKSVDALSQLVVRDNARMRGKQIVDKLKEVISRHQFKIAIQAAIGGSIVARSDISALRKNVTAKCYGGDISRKRKLLEKQKEGKKRMKTIGNVDIPQKAFTAVLKSDN